MEFTTKTAFEVYRDIDSDFNGKPDQYRWLNAGGTRWGVDKRDANKLETGKSTIGRRFPRKRRRPRRSPRWPRADVERFRRLLLTPDELQSLGLDKARRRPWRRNWPRRKAISTPCSTGRPASRRRRNGCKWAAPGPALCPRNPTVRARTCGFTRTSSPWCRWATRAVRCRSARWSRWGRLAADCGAEHRPTGRRRRPRRASFSSRRQPVGPRLLQRGSTRIRRGCWRSWRKSINSTRGGPTCSNRSPTWRRRRKSGPLVSSDGRHDQRGGPVGKIADGDKRLEALFRRLGKSERDAGLGGLRAFSASSPPDMH